LQFRQLVSLGSELLEVGSKVLKIVGGEGEEGVYNTTQNNS